MQHLKSNNDNSRPCGVNSYLRAVSVFVVGLCSAFSFIVVGASNSVGEVAKISVYPNTSVGVIGHGWGHGYGMGQWGALGYALDGQSYSWILSHYYGNTTPKVVANTNIRVIITSEDGKTTIVTSESPFSVDGFTIPANDAVMLVAAGSGEWSVYQGSSCAGPWNSSPLETAQQPMISPGTPSSTSTTSTTSTTSAPSGPTPPADTTTSTTTSTTIPSSSSTTTPTTTTTPPSSTGGYGPDATANQVLQLCEIPSNEFLRGDIEPATYQGSSRTINVLPIESYLRGVVPSESPAYWGTLGGNGPQGEPWGFQELEAQAVAARSYALSDMGEFGYADICDSTECQVYGGFNAENYLTDYAVADTAGEVLVNSQGAIANTEFSASTGGYTSGGSFPAVPDAGDSVCVASACNPNHTWDASIAVSQIESTWPQIGTLVSIGVTSRSGYGAYGGRAEQVEITGTNGSVSVGGTTFEADFGLNSNFFAFTGTPRGGADGYWLVSSTGSVFTFGKAGSFGSLSGKSTNGSIVSIVATADNNGYWLAGSDGSVDVFGDAFNYGNAKGISSAPIVAMVATPDTKGYWLVASNGGVFSFGDAQFYGSMGGKPLNQPIVGMDTTPDGQGYWLVASDGGIFSFGDAQFYGSTGAITLDKPIFGMSSTLDGKGYWLVASDGGIFSFGDAQFYGSMPGQALYATATGMVTSPDGLGYEIVTANGEVNAFGDAPRYGDLSVPDPGYSGTIVSIAMRQGS